MKVVTGKITEIGNQTISSKGGTTYSNVVLVNEAGDRLRISNLACDDGTDNRVFIGNQVILHLLQTRAPIRKWNILVAVEDSEGLTLARSPGVVALIGALMLGFLTALCVINVWVLMIPLVGGLFLTLGIPTFKLFGAIRHFSPKSADSKVSRMIEV